MNPKVDPIAPTDVGQLTSHGFSFETAASALGELSDSSLLVGNVPALSERMSEDGYLLLRGYLNPSPDRCHLFGHNGATEQN